MANKSRWQYGKPWGDGFFTIDLSSWKHFHAYVHQEMLKYYTYIWRGQRDSEWKLRSSLDRVLSGTPKADRSARVAEHLERFKYASRGRGAGYSRDMEENEWWAMGQHNGLATPLLDWTESPFVALYFAFSKAERPVSGYRSVWALGDIEGVNKIVRKAHKDPNSAPPTLDYVRPLWGDNSRLVNQAALSTRGPLGVPVEEWIQSNLKKTPYGAYGLLIHVRIPDEDRLNCLRTLNRMNINHKTLFPDLYGSADYCNKALRIQGY
jgi:hypothetical protein